MAQDSKRVVSRMSKELERLKKDPPHGITCWPVEGRLNHLEARLLGGQDTPYEGGVFKLEIRIPNRYPFEPPHVQFLTKIYHPNIDTAGRICLDVLKSPPTGSWKPAQSLHSILTSIQLLLAEPNPDDGLMADISREYKHQRPAFLVKAKQWTCQYAKDTSTEASCLTREDEMREDEVSTEDKLAAASQSTSEGGRTDCAQTEIGDGEKNAGGQHRVGVKRKRVADD